MSFLFDALVFLAAAVIAVPISKRLGLGSVLGYLAAGIAIGPSVLGLVSDVEAILHFAELGVVLLLFVIGLELHPERLWIMRRQVFGLGGGQVLATGAVLTGAGVAFGLAPVTAVVVGLSLALSSTAFALQTLAEKRQLTTRHGRAAFAVLLFQDVAVIPMMAAIPLLAPDTVGIPASDAHGAAESGPGSVWAVLAVLVGVVVGGRYLLRFVLSLVVRSGVREIFTALALLTVTGAAAAMYSVGLSMALGAFLAGMLLADSEYRHALEADIEPFKGLLLGLFFIAVGMSVDLALMVDQPLTVGGLVVGLLAVKIAVLLGIGRAGGLKGTGLRVLAVALPQGGEFAFVLFGVAGVAGLMPPDLSALLILVVTLSMAVTPLLFLLQEYLDRRRPTVVPQFDAMPGDIEPEVIIAGFGRVGQIVGRVLRARRIPFTALEKSPEQVDFVRKFGNRVYYGDAAEEDLLRAAGADRARLLVLAIDDPDQSLRAAEIVRQSFPHLKVLARARNRRHVHQLMDLGVERIWREAFLTSCAMAEAVLTGLGHTPSEAARAVQRFREHDERNLYAAYASYSDEEKLIALAKAAQEELAELFDADERAAAEERAAANTKDAAD